MAVYTKPTSTKMISDAQRNLIKKLADQRDWSNFKESHKHVITSVLNEDEDPIFMFKASCVIDDMLKLPVIAKVQAQKELTYTELQELLKTLPASKYAFLSKDNTWAFVEIAESKKTKKRYVNRLIGAPGDWHRKFLSLEESMKVARWVIKLGPKQCAVDYAQQHGRCAVCDAHLSDPESIANSMGPICQKKFI